MERGSIQKGGPLGRVKHGKWEHWEWGAFGREEHWGGRSIGEWEHWEGGIIGEEGALGKNPPNASPQSSSALAPSPMFCGEKGA